MTVLGVALGGALGALARAAVSRLGLWGTVAVNLSGCFAAGVVAGAGGHTALATGFLGAYTTFATWSVQTVALLEEGRWRVAVLNAIGSLAAGTALAAAGVALA